jgi:hypothetical protein
VVATLRGFYRIEKYWRSFKFIAARSAGDSITSSSNHHSMGLYLLDYGAGNVQSLANSLSCLGYKFKWISSAADFANATVSLLSSHPH